MSMRSLSLFALAGLLLARAALADGTIRVEVDARESSRGLQSARLAIPVSPGTLKLRYPQWIPGNHRPSGTITSLTGLAVEAGGKAIPWQRDPLDMFSFLIEVPAGVSELQVRLDSLGVIGAQAPTADRRATDALAVIQWNRLVLYPDGAPSDAQQFQASILLPEGWQHGGALRVAKEAGNRVDFEPVSLTTLIDSPLLTGRNFRTLELGGKPAVKLHAAADSQAALAVRPEIEQGLRRLVAEALALYGAVHYREYHFLLSLSSQADGYGLEHHESSDNWAGERALADLDAFRATANLLPHEYTHSWNGKYRRPAGLATASYHQPMQADLLWVYEGLTEYLQEVLSVRSGIFSAQDYVDEWAYAAGEMSLHKGRDWRTLSDTARGVQTMRGQPQDWLSRRRGVDYYTEGSLLWLEADVLIRTRSKGRRSLDDFCRAFLGGGKDTAPAVVPYTVDDVIAALNAVEPYDWRAFWSERLERRRAGAPLEGLEAAGWRLVYTSSQSALHRAYDEVSKRIDLRASLGFNVGSEDGYLGDVIPGSPADKAGMAPGSVLVAVNGRKWSRTLLDDALAASVDTSATIELLVQDTDVFHTLKLEYQGGARYPRLERKAGTRDVLEQIARPLAKP